MKRIIVLIMVTVSLLSMAGCSFTENKAQTEGTLT